VGSERQGRSCRDGSPGATESHAGEIWSGATSLAGPIPRSDDGNLKWPSWKMVTGVHGGLFDHQLALSSNPNNGFEQHFECPTVIVLVRWNRSDGLCSPCSVEDGNLFRVGRGGNGEPRGGKRTSGRTRTRLGRNPPKPNTTGPSQPVQVCLSHSKTSRYNTEPAQKNREIRVAFPA
jgi:hypothetical protein